MTYKRKVYNMCAILNTYLATCERIVKSSIFMELLISRQPMYCANGAPYKSCDNYNCKYVRLIWTTYPNIKCNPFVYNELIWMLRPLCGFN